MVNKAALDRYRSDYRRARDRHGVLEKILAEELPNRHLKLEATCTRTQYIHYVGRSSCIFLLGGYRVTFLERVPRRRLPFSGNLSVPPRGCWDKEAT